ncbi:hypothetical protein PSTG_16316 [Puccinia striiformis f. sp. tritici PST-78]|uniref:Uncharacterized protein n=1 Tax=Puccinia striiformis f. sp. tritici PST-78 TaxID=1165861 RepID=A0A0L0UT93_9BASI|nr:hypothetical protein PSTG_16316 [Puccinia striiformis f. sp. tritici PST-78]
MLRQVFNWGRLEGTCGEPSGFVVNHIDGRFRSHKLRKGLKSAGAAVQGTALLTRIGSKQTLIPASYWTEYLQTKKVSTIFKRVLLVMQEAKATVGQYYTLRYLPYNGYTVIGINNRYCWLLDVILEPPWILLFHYGSLPIRNTYIVHKELAGKVAPIRPEGKESDLDPSEGTNSSPQDKSKPKVRAMLYY